jgi:hypothetical protein
MPKVYVTQSGHEEVCLTSKNGWRSWYALIAHDLFFSLKWAWTDEEMVQT